VSISLSVLQFVAQLDEAIRRLEAFPETNNCQDCWRHAQGVVMDFVEAKLLPASVLELIEANPRAILGLQGQPFIHALKRLRNGLNGAPNGPAAPDKFRWGQLTVQGLAPDQFRLLSLLWDTKSSQPAPSVSIKAVLEHVCLAAGNQQEALRKLRMRTQEKLTDAGVPLSIHWKSKALSLIPDG
jgi:hypothetical protein